MLCNLKAELVRKGLEPTKTVAKSIKCNEKTARNKLEGRSQFTIAEANLIIKDFFKTDGFSIEYLFTAS